MGPTGADRVQFVMDANRGQTKGPVDVVASSGEKSRLLLLLETRLPPPQARSSAEIERRALDIDTETGRDSISAGNIVSSRGYLKATDDAVKNGVTRASPCAVLYDEIDAHVGGRTAVAVGRLLSNQGRRSQVSGLIINVLWTILSPDVAGYGLRQKLIKWPIFCEGKSTVRICVLGSSHRASLSRLRGDKSESLSSVVR